LSSIEQIYHRTHGVAMGTKTAVSFANIFIAEIEENLIQQNKTKPREWKRYILITFSPFGTVKEMNWIVSSNKLTYSTQRNNKIHGRNIRERNNFP